MNIPFRYLIAVVAVGTLGIQQQGYCDDSDASIFGDTTASGIRDWFAEPENRHLFDSQHRLPMDEKVMAPSDLAASELLMEVPRKEE